MARVPKGQEEAMLRKGYVTSREAAQPLGMSRGHIARLAAAGKVRSCKVGHILYVDVRKLAETMGDGGAKLLAPLIRRVAAIR